MSWVSFELNAFTSCTVRRLDHLTLRSGCLTMRCLDHGHLNFFVAALVRNSTRSSPCLNTETPDSVECYRQSEKFLPRNQPIAVKASSHATSKHCAAFVSYISLPSTAYPLLHTSSSRAPDHDGATHLSWKCVTSHVVESQNSRVSGLSSGSRHTAGCPPKLASFFMRTANSSTIWWQMGNKAQNGRATS